jgi:hypothetical protein
LLSKVRNRGTLYSTLLEAPLLAVLIGVTLRSSPEGAYEYPTALHLPAYLFLSATVAMFLGLTNSATDILRDRPILRRERNSRPSPALYVGAKFCALGLVAAAQCLAYTAIGHSLLEIRGTIPSQWLWMTLTACTGTGLALLVSSLVKTERAALTAVPLLYGNYTSSNDSGTFSLEPPDELNVGAGLPILNQAAVDAADKAIERRMIRSPIDGVIEDLSKHQGEWLQPGDMLAHVLRTDTLRVEGYIDAAKWDPGEVRDRPVTVSVTLANGKQEEFTGRIVFVSERVESGGDYRVYADVPNRRGVASGEWLLRAGQTAKMTIHASQPPATR